MMKQWIVNDVEFEADEINKELAVSPWSGHRQFAYDLVTFLKPMRIVELGTHFGCSFFAFLQACKDFNLDSQVIAIDSWEGDEQAGFYGEEVWKTVNKTLKEKFSNQNYILLRKYFDNALDDIEDESIDILHIDGLHTYEAVSVDFNSWLCKLKNNGIVLFHDIASKLNYGTNVFWNEIKDKYPHHYTFEHSWGLGILFPKGDEYYYLFEQQNMRDKILVYEYYSEYKLQNIQLHDHIIMVEERDKVINSMDGMIKERDKSIGAMDDMIKERDKSISSIEEMIKKRDEYVVLLENKIKVNENDIHTMEIKSNELQGLVEKKTNEIDNLNQKIDSNSKYIKYLLDRPIIKRIFNMQ